MFIRVNVNEVYTYVSMYYFVVIVAFSLILLSLQKFSVLPVDFSISGGELTPTMKMKRKVILAKYHDLVAEMYKES